jgi:hypothetical protein
VGTATIADTDGDGKMEIIHSLNAGSASRLLIFENQADNSYVMVANLPTLETNGAKVIADFDGDGLQEIAFSGTHVVHVVEAKGDNIWQQTWSQNTGLVNAYGAVGGFDTDGNGRLEMFVLGYGPEAATTRVIEATGDDQYAVVATLLAAPGTTSHICTLSHLDGPAATEYVIYDGARRLVVYRAIAPGMWIIVEQYDDPTPLTAHTDVHSFDLNSNGRDEIFWSLETKIQAAPTGTLILERPESSLTDVPRGPQPTPLTLLPNPSHGPVQIRFTAPTSVQSTLVVYDAAGRRLQHVSVPTGAAAIALRPMDRIVAGVYFVRLESNSGVELGSSRLVIARH